MSFSGGGRYIGRDEARREAAATGGNRKVWETGMVPHIWAAQSQAELISGNREARSGNGNVYFHGPSCYSYGSHFPTGVIVRAADQAGGLVFLNADSYSPTTSAHQGNASGAVSHFRGRHYLPALKDVRELLERAAQGAKPSDSIWGYRDAGTLKAAALKYLQNVAGSFAAEDSDSGYGRQAGPSAARAFGGCFGLTAKQVDSALAKGRAADQRRKAEEIAATRRREYREAFTLANMTPDAFADWAKGGSTGGISGYGYGASLREAYQLSNDSISEAEGAADLLAKRLRRAAKLIKGERVAGALPPGSRLNREKAAEAFKAHLLTVATHKAMIRPRALAKYRVQQAAKIREFRADWRAAVASGDRFRMVNVRDESWRVTQARDSVMDRWIERNVKATVAPFEVETRAEAARLIQEKTEREARERAERLERERAEREARNAALRAAWLEGEPNGYRGERPDGTPYIRRSRDGADLQTSWAASVPWEHAVRAFRFIKLCRTRGESFQANGRQLRVGHFRVDSIDTQGNMKAGCHRFAWAEIERLARAEGVWECEPSAEAVTGS